jgi:DNA modification methylase
MQAIRRVLTKDGNVAIVIRPHLKDGQISDYVLRTRLALREVGWIECEELIWIKPTAPPLGHVSRPRRSWESILWFAPTVTPFCDSRANGMYSHRLGLESIKGMGDYLHDREMRETGHGIARCRDYVEVPTHETNQDMFNNHPAQFPERLAAWLLGLLCPRDGCVLDPFAGSGSTLVAAKKARRYQYVGVEIDTAYVEIARRRLAAVSTVAENLITWD